MNELLTLCKSLQPLNDKTVLECTSDMEDEDLNETKLDIILKEIWGESGSDSDESEVFCDNKEEDLNEQDYQDIRSSQRQKLERQKGNVQKNESSDEANDQHHKSKPETSQINAYKYETGIDVNTDNCFKAATDVNIYDHVKQNFKDNIENISVNSTWSFKRKSSVSNNEDTKSIAVECIYVCERNVKSNNSSPDDNKYPHPKRVRYSECDSSNKQRIEILDASTKSEVQSKRLFNEFAMENSIDKAKEVAYCGLSFDSSFTNSRSSLNETANGNLVNCSQLDSSSTDLFGSPSHTGHSKKLLFKCCKKDKSTGIDINAGINEKETNKKETQEKCEFNTVAAVAGMVSGQDISSISDDDDDDDDDLEITGDNFMELSQNSPKFSGTKFKNTALSKEIPGNLCSDLEVTGNNVMELSPNSQYIGHSKFKSTTLSREIPVNKDTCNTGDLDLHNNSFTKNNYIDSRTENKTVSSAQMKIAGKQDDTHLNSEMNALENFDFDNSFNESLNCDLDLRDVSANNCSAVSNILTIDRNSIEKSFASATKADDLDSSGIEVVDVDSDSSDVNQEVKNSEIQHQCMSPEFSCTKMKIVGKVSSTSSDCVDELSCTIIDDESSTESVEEQIEGAQKSYTEGNNLFLSASKVRDICNSRIVLVCFFFCFFSCCFF